MTALWKEQIPPSLPILDSYKRSGISESRVQEEFFQDYLPRLNIRTLSPAQQQAIIMAFHVANEGCGSRGRGAKQKKQGLKKGVWDVFLETDPLIRIEFKVGYNGLTDEQIDYAWMWHRRGGVVMAVCYSALDAIRLIERSLMLIPMEV